jgi:serine protease Do
MERHNDKISRENIDDNNLDINSVEETLIQGETFVMKASDKESENHSKEDSYTMKAANYSDGGANMYSHYNDEQNNGTLSYRNYSENRERPKKKRSGMFKKMISYILVGVICAGIGGVSAGVATLYLLPRTNFFKNTEFYKSIVDGVNRPVYVNHPTTLAAEKDALTVAEIARKAGPAVVAVTTRGRGTSGLFGNQPQQGVGSGMIINEDGYVLTNYHVVQGAQEVKIVLSDGKEVNAKLINYDAEYDVAIVKITDKIQVPGIVELGDSSVLQVGESVVAIGNPLGKEFLGTVTTGIVSALDRQIDIRNREVTYIQTDAAINNGNSGGPLINSRGQVIGINTAKIKDSGVEGLGFAIPIDVIKDKIQDLSRPILMVGISGREVTEEIAKQYNFPIGVYIREVVEFSPAERAGLKPGDIIVRFDGEKVRSINDINRLKNKRRAGDVVNIIISRDGKERTIELELAER